MRDQFTVVLEDLRSHFRAFGENLDFVRSDVKEVKKTVNLHTQMIGQLMVDVQEIKTELKAKVDRDEFARLEKRVITLETRSVQHVKN